MTAKEFFDLVKEMRSAQKDYFQYRQPDDLRKSKKLEKEVDDEIKRAELVMYERKQLKFL